MNKSQTWYEIREALSTDQCPVCTVVDRSLARYMQSIHYESVEDQQIRTQLQNARGFCPTHAHQWLTTTSILGTAQIYNDVLKLAMDDIRAAKFTPNRSLGKLTNCLSGKPKPNRTGSIRQPTGTCLLCDHREMLESATVTTLLDGLSDTDFSASYRSSNGLCVPHLRRAMGMSTSVTTFEMLRATALAGEEKMVEHLREIMRKFDYRFREEPAGEETGGAARAVRHIVGTAP